jgi:hypothetical protein
MPKIEECRIVLVDDEADKLEGRRSWLTAANFEDVTILNFPQALRYQYWEHVHTLVIDGFDNDEDDDRESWIAKIAPGDRLLELDRYVGVRVVRAARKANPNLVITVVSGYVDNSPELVQRFHKRGANYIYSNRAARSKDDFLAAVRSPGQGRGYVPPDRGRKVANVEKLLDILDGGHSEWDPAVVKAARRVLIHGEDRDDVLASEARTVSIRRFNSLMDYIKELSGYEEGAAGERKPHLKRIRSYLIKKVLGGEHREDRNGPEK